MARTKQTPQSPNVDRPVAAIQSDIQSAERRPTPRPLQGKVLTKGGKQPRKHLSKKLLHLSASPTGGIKKSHCYRPGLLAFCEICQYQKVYRMFDKEDLLSKTNLGNFSRLPDMPSGFRNPLNAGRVPVHSNSHSPGGCQNFIVGLFKDIYLLAIHAKQVTMMPRDIRLALRIHGDHYQWQITQEDVVQHECHSRRKTDGGRATYNFMN